MKEKTLTNRQKNLRLVRRIREIGQDELDDMLEGVKRGRTYSYEAGNANPSNDFIKKAAKALGIPDWRLFDSDDILGVAMVEETIMVPYWGLVPCGDWETPHGDVEEVPVPAKLKNMEGIIAVRVMGESMAPLLRTGDLVPIKRTKRASDGAVVLVRNQDRDLTLKVARYHGQWEFHPVNPKFHQVRAEEVELIGTLVLVPERFDPDGIAVP